MISIEPAVVVEGTYDKIRLSSLLDALIIPTNGFQIFKDTEKMDLLQSLAKTRGVLVLTDSDHAGFMIRNRIKQALTQGTVYHGYIPDIYGKEKLLREESNRELLAPPVQTQMKAHASTPFFGKQEPFVAPSSTGKSFQPGSWMPQDGKSHNQ